MQAECWQKIPRQTDILNLYTEKVWSGQQQGNFPPSYSLPNAWAESHLMCLVRVLNINIFRTHIARVIV